jgi:molecular chaperone HscB
MTSLDRDQFTKDHFALLGLARQQDIDDVELERVYRDIQSQVHPDKHAHQGESDRRLSMQWATRVNEAYLTLKSPLKRAEYLLRLVGHDPEIEHNTAMPTDFLMQQMEWRERVEQAHQAADVERLDGFHGSLRAEMAAQYAELAGALDVKRDYASAAQIVRQLMFKEKLLHEIDDALAAAEA